MKIRIKFTKTGDLKYIGHLDVMRFFQKALRRACFDLTYSQGFNPHPVMSFASPLGIGLTSLGEYVDIELNTSESSERMLKRLNAVMCPEIIAKSFVLLPEGTRTNAMATLAAADYDVPVSAVFADLLGSPEAVTERIAGFLSLETISIRKKTKSKEVDQDIRCGILKLTYDEDGFHMFLVSGSAYHLKPEAVLDAFFAYLGQEWSADELFIAGELGICRLDMYALKDGAYVPMDQLGEVI